MPFTQRFITDLLAYEFQNVAIAGIGDAAGLQPSAVAGSFFISLHTALPGAAADQTTNEVSLAAYPTYARVAMPRNNVTWGVFENRVRALIDATFPACVGGTSPNVTYFGIGLLAAGAGRLCHYGILGPSTGLVVAPGVTPRVPANLLAVYSG